MIHSVCASTYEVDDIQLALDEILSKLNLPEISTYKYRAGLVTATDEYFENGFFDLLSSALPFDFLGFQTVSCVTADADAEQNLLNLSIVVFLSNDVAFAVGSSEITDKTYAKDIQALYHSLAAGHSSPPAMILTAANVFATIAADDLLGAIDAASGGVPCFGSIGIRFLDTSADFFDAKTMYNNALSTSRISFILFCGDIQPYFEVLSIPPSKILNQNALITDAQGVAIKAINNVPAAKYFQSIGFDTTDLVHSMSLVPIVIHYGDNTQPVARNIYRIDPEDNDIYLAGSAPKGATIGIGSVDKQDVINGAIQLAESVSNYPSPSVALAFTCASRIVALGYDMNAEISAFSGNLPKGLSYLLASSGGEICPVISPPPAKGYVNRFHNNSIILCVLR